VHFEPFFTDSIEHFEYPRESDLRQRSLSISKEGGHSLVDKSIEIAATRKSRKFMVKSGTEKVGVNLVG
jgi:hypothetical protein